MVRRMSLLLAALALQVHDFGTPARGQVAPGQARKVVKTDAEWARQLTRAQFSVTRRKATEPAFSGKYVSNHARGTYVCVCCAAPLFASQAKFDSGTGWPSFWAPVDPKRIETAPDREMAEPRVEVLCRDCGAHLGHVFNDGPPPTYLRFCINSLSLKFAPASGATSSASAKAKARSKARAKKKSAPADHDETAPAGEAPADPPAEKSAGSKGG